MLPTYRKLAFAVFMASASVTTFAQTKPDTDAQISALADKIEQELLNDPTMPPDIAATFQKAAALLPNASDAGKKLLNVDLPQRLRKDAEEKKAHSDVDGNMGKAINLTVVAEFIDGQITKTTPVATAQPPPPPPTPRTPPAAQVAPLPPPVVKITPSPPPSIATAKPLDQGLVQRGDIMVSQGNIEAARMLYERAANDGVGSAALKLGETYDPVFLTSHHLIGPKADPQQAEAWYRKASALGEAEAARRLKLMADKE